jgi:hypothetical protein
LIEIEKEGGCGAHFRPEPLEKHAMPDSGSAPTHAHFKWQAATVAVALVAAITIVRSASPPPPPPAEYEMLAYLDERVGQKENRKDVRCWSSFNKLGMFITGCEIDEPAKSERIEQHMKLIQSLWETARAKSTGADIIPAAVVSGVLKERFPHAADVDGVSFQFGGGAPTLVMADELRDYDDTIEPWRLLQTWASRNLDERGRFAPTPVFGVEALKVMYNFLKSYDLAVQREARRVAMERREAGIGAEAMAAAFESSQRPEKP